MTDAQLSEFISAIPTEEATKLRYSNSDLAGLVNNFVILTQEVFAILYSAREKDAVFIEEFLNSVKVKYLGTIHKYNDLSISNTDLIPVYQEAISAVSQEITVARSVLSRPSVSSLN